uniref:Uma2 family endonuclease n=1 Tax=Paractinoplanes polyasparticus TaxID=2856853 RepID=UPI001C84FD35|nr:Uma2 family endonuclease [Actinoplanes polyasparticus]
MTAEPISDLSAAGFWVPDPVKQRAAGYTIEDILRLPDDVPRVELTDGVLSVVPSHSGAHQKINGRLIAWLDQHLPESLEALFAVGVAVGHRNTLEPDGLILHAPVDLEHHFYEPDQVVVAIEIVSPGTKRRDRLEKPAVYASVGIPHYWRIEQNPVHIYAYDLVGGRYELVADADEELVLTAPYELRLPIREITP